MTASEESPERGNGHAGDALLCYERFEEQRFGEQLRELARTDPEQARALGAKRLSGCGRC